jgi:hypothetical protein
MWKHTSLSLLFGCFACGGQEPVLAISELAPTMREQAILALANDPYVTLEELDHGVELDARAARNIVAARPFETYADLDAVPYVGPSALEKLYQYALEYGYMSTYSPRSELPIRDDVRYDEADLIAALEQARIDDANAVLTRAKLRFDDGDRILDFEELAMAASSCREDIYRIAGYRFSESAVARILEAFELEDRLALLAAGTAHDYDANRYLTLRELERARLDL